LKRCRMRKKKSEEKFVVGKAAIDRGANWKEVGE